MSSQNCFPILATPHVTSIVNGFTGSAICIYNNVIAPIYIRVGLFMEQLGNFSSSTLSASWNAPPTDIVTGEIYSRIFHSHLQLWGLEPHYGQLHFADCKCAQVSRGEWLLKAQSVPHLNARVIETLEGWCNNYSKRGPIPISILLNIQIRAWFRNILISSTNSAN